MILDAKRSYQNLQIENDRKIGNKKFEFQEPMLTSKASCLFKKSFQKISLVFHNLI